MNEPEVIDEMLAEGTGRTIAVVGLSNNPAKPSNYVSEYMQRHGYKIYPVNPTLQTVLGEKSYPSLAELPVKPNIVNVFRVPSMVPGIVTVALTDPVASAVAVVRSVGVEAMSIATAAPGANPDPKTSTDDPGATVVTA